MTNVSGWSLEMDRKLDRIEKDPEAYFDGVRDSTRDGVRSSLRHLVSNVASTLMSLVGHR